MIPIKTRAMNSLQKTFFKNQLQIKLVTRDQNIANLPRKERKQNMLS